MTKSETLQMRFDPDDARALRESAERSCMSLSKFVRHELEPAVVAAKVADIARSFGYIARVTLFGSMALHEHDDSSDIDLAIETDGPYKWMGEAGMGRFVGRIEAACGRSVDVVKLKYCTPQFAEAVQREGRVVYER